MSKILVKLKNPGTIVGVVSAGIFIATNVGFDVDNEAIMNITKGICTMGVLLGFMNNPNTPGLDIPFLESEE